MVIFDSHPGWRLGDSLGFKATFSLSRSALTQALHSQRPMIQQMKLLGSIVMDGPYLD